MPEATFAEWKNYLQQQRDVHLLQTAEWGELKAAFGWEAVRLIARDGQGVQILFRRLPLGLTVAYLPKPVASERLLAAGGLLWEEIQEACRRKKAVFLKIEPDLWSGPHPDPALNLKSSRYNIQPPRTILVDLRGKDEEILAHMKQKCRYNIRLAEKKDIRIHTWDDLEGFHQLMLITAGRDAFGIHSLEYYRRAYDLFHPAGLCELFMAEFDSQPLAALMVFARGRRAWYIYGASSEEERNRMPTYLLQWEAMRWAKARGCEEYDLWGIPDEDEADLEANFESRQDGLWGVYRFKRGFGGEIRRAAQALDRIYNPLVYPLYLWRMAGREGG